MNRNAVEYHVGMVMMTATGSDRKFSDEEVEGMIAFLGGMFEAMGSDTDPADYINELMDDLNSFDDDEVSTRINKAIETLPKKLNEEQLEALYGGLAEIVDLDGTSKQEKNFLNALKKVWFS